jgi:hypothetical protein
VPALDSYTARCALFSSTGGAKLQRECRRKKCSSTGRPKTTFTHYYAFNKIKYSNKIINQMIYHS